MYSEPALLHYAHNFIQTIFPGVVNLPGASRLKVALVNGEYQRVEHICVIVVERTIYEEVVVMVCGHSDLVLVLRRAAATFLTALRAAFKVNAPFFLIGAGRTRFTGMEVPPRERLKSTAIVHTGRWR